MKYEDSFPDIAYFKYTTKEGETRFFKWNRATHDVIQVVSSVVLKKGRGNRKGLYQIAENSFVYNYYWMFDSQAKKRGFDHHKKLESCSESDFRNACSKTMKTLGVDYSL